WNKKALERLSDEDLSREFRRQMIAEDAESMLAKKKADRIFREMTEKLTPEDLLNPESDETKAKMKAIVKEVLPSKPPVLKRQRSSENLRENQIINNNIKDFEIPELQAKDLFKPLIPDLEVKVAPLSAEEMKEIDSESEQQQYKYALLNKAIYSNNPKKVLDSSEYGKDVEIIKERTNYMVVQMPDFGRNRAVIVVKGTDISNVKGQRQADLLQDVGILLNDEQMVTRTKEIDKIVKKLLDSKIDPTDIIVTGHSLGGYIANKVSKDNDISGVVFNMGSSPIGRIRKNIGRLENENLTHYTTNVGANVDFVSATSARFDKFNTVQVEPNQDIGSGLIKYHTIDHFLKGEDLDKIKNLDNNKIEEMEQSEELKELVSQYKNVLKDIESRKEGKKGRYSRTNLAYLNRLNEEKRQLKEAIDQKVLGGDQEGLTAVGMTEKESEPVSKTALEEVVVIKSPDEIPSLPKGTRFKYPNSNKIYTQNFVEAVVVNSHPEALSLPQGTKYKLPNSGGIYTQQFDPRILDRLFAEQQQQAPRDRLADNSILGVNQNNSNLSRIEVQEENVPLRDDPAPEIIDNRPILVQDEVLEGEEEKMPYGEAENVMVRASEMGIASNNMSSMEQNYFLRQAGDVRRAQLREFGGEDEEQEFKDEGVDEEDDYDVGVDDDEDIPFEGGMSNREAREAQLRSLRFNSRGMRLDPRTSKDWRKVMRNKARFDDLLKAQSVRNQAEIPVRLQSRTTASNNVNLIRRSNQTMSIAMGQLLP
ncbi:MAG: YqiA/YcfP family alpha/beta fold hydrolase, partial [Candidatus Heimdallarchaeaceae archaeon]